MHCGRKQIFHKNELKPFEVSESAYALGHAAPGNHSKPQARYIKALAGYADRGEGIQTC
jgi:hypothetical protein